MKRKGNVYPRILDWPNLLVAAKKARRGKRYRRDVADFHWNMEAELLAIQGELTAMDYTPGAYRSFEISDPKRRMISAAPYRDRVVHHAICNVIEPILDRGFVHDSYACRMGKGQTLAVKRAIHFMRRYRYVARTDVRKYFASADHQILLDLFQRRFKDQALFWLVDRIVRMPFPRQVRPSFFPGDDLLSNAERTCGLPLGNQTSQLFGNFYLDEMDHLLSESRRLPAMLRYMDDIVLFSNSKRQLWETLEWMSEYLRQSRRLRLHDRKTSLTSTEDGIRFLGYHVRRSDVRLFPESLVRLRRRMKRLQWKLDHGEIDLMHVRQSVAAYWGFVQVARCRRTFRQILTDFPFWELLRRCG